MGTALLKGPHSLGLSVTHTPGLPTPTERISLQHYNTYSTSLTLRSGLRAQKLRGSAVSFAYFPDFFRIRITGLCTDGAPPQAEDPVSELPGSESRHQIALRYAKQTEQSNYVFYKLEFIKASK